jgi:hypothetical protein
MVTTVEQHAIAGPNYWFRTWCPASHLLIPLSAKGIEVLRENDRRLAEAVRERAGRQVAPVDLDEANRAIERRRQAGTLGHLDGDPRLYYPPRPSDVEEVEGLPVPEGVSLHPHTGRGAQNVTSANDETINLINLAKQALSNAQEECSKGTNIVDLLDATLGVVNEHLTAGVQLVAAAAMGSTVTPRLADEASANIAQAGVNVDDASARAAGALTKVNDAFASAAHAIEKLDEFLAQLSA